MRRFALSLSALISVVLLAAATATADTYSDPAGDATGGPDITAVTVTDDAAGMVTMHMAAALSTTAPSVYGVFLDTDANGKTQDATGRAVMVAAAPGFTGSTVVDAQGSTVSVPSLKTTATATDLAITFAAKELGIGRSFNFWLASMPADPNASDFADEAPNGDMWSYTLTVKPVIGKATTSPARPVHGKRLTVRFPVTRSDDGQPLTDGRMVCDPSVKGKVVKHAESFTGGSAKLSFVVPKSSKAKLLKVKVRIIASGGTATRVATFKVR